MLIDSNIGNTISRLVIYFYNDGGLEKIYFLESGGEDLTRFVV